jgi:uncharacterized repeat protein (TIGR03803 family)
MTDQQVRAIVTIVASAFLASCGGGQVPIAAPFGSAQQIVAAQQVVAEQRVQSSPAYHVLYAFSRERSAPRHPYAGLISDGTTLYGTTAYGDSGSCYEGCGVVYALTTTGTLTTIHRFVSGTTDGHDPVTALTKMGSTLYGTTGAGGSGTNCNDGCGTVFSISGSGDETLLHSFAGGTSDGADPRRAMIDVDGTLYGSTQNGGKHGFGTIFSISASGAETVLHSFAGNSTDGASSSSPLVNVNGTLYGTTATGGASDKGIVYSITPSGTETIIYSFKGGTSDGASPNSLIDVNGALYGTTGGGGAATHCRGGCGIFFKMSTAGSETVLHSFTNALGSGSKSLMKYGNAFYGTASSGGTWDKGTLFKISPKGVTAVLHSFGYGTFGDGKDPVGRLLVVKGTIYGATLHGGGANKGTIYTLTL